MFYPRITTTRLKAISTCSSLLILLASGCGPKQAYPGPRLPADQTAELRINPPQAQVGFQLLSVNDTPFNAEIDASLRPGTTKLTFIVWPTSRTVFNMSGPAFAEHYQLIDEKYEHTMSITFTAEAGIKYGLAGSFNERTEEPGGSYEVNVFEIGPGTVVARASSENATQEADASVEHLQERQREQWSVEEGPGS